MINHFGKFLNWAGSPIKMLSEDIEMLWYKKQRLENELFNLRKTIQMKENEFIEIVNLDWNENEIKEAKLKAFKNSFFIEEKVLFNEMIGNVFEIKENSIIVKFENSSKKEFFLITKEKEKNTIDRITKFTNY